MKYAKFILAGILALALSCGGKEETEDTGASLKVPTGVKLHSASGTTMQFQWDVVKNATGYDWRLLSGTTEVKSGSENKRNTTITELSPGITYKFQVRATIAAEELVSDWSTAIDAVIPVDDSGDDTGGEGGDDSGGEGGDDTGGEGGDDSGGTSAEAYAQFLIPEVEDADGKARAFPGAEGGGMYTTGGRGGKVLHVTNLNDSGTGSLRWACTQNYARIIVFDVAGVIELQSQLKVSYPNCTIAGQTAPGDGICLKNYTFRINASNVIVRFIRCRMGDEKQTEDDAIQIMDHDDDKFSNIIIDHCSVSWCTDECASFYGMKAFTFSWNIASESLRVSIHEKGTHGYGGIWGGNDACYHHNLLAHHDSRNPRIDHDYVSTQKGPLSIMNNVVYNWRGNTCYGGESCNTTNTYRKYNFVGNYYKPGPATSSHYWFLDPTVSCSNCTSAMGCSTIVPGHFYMTGNYMYGKSAISSDNWSGLSSNGLKIVSTIKSNSQFKESSNPSYMTLHSAENAFDKVLAYAGASLVRDAVDTRIAKETKNGTATYKGSKSSISGLIDTQSDVGGWPTYSYSSDDEKLTDTDKDGMPDWFEEKFGLNKSSATDMNAKTLDPKGRYTNLEMYLHYLVKDIVAAQNAGGTYTSM